MNKPTANHWKVTKRVLRYIKNTNDIGLIYRRQVEPVQANIITAYADANYAKMLEATSISGCIVLINGASIGHSSITQKATAQFTAEGDYYSLEAAGQDVAYLRQLSNDLGCPHPGLATIYTDNQACISISHTNSNPKKTCHIDTKLHMCVN
eukprot:scaffold232218_cov14-Prasinocladus_malaysianus.AAC.2